MAQLTFNQIYQKGTDLLKSGGIDCFGSDSLWLFEKCFGLNRKDIIVKGNEGAPYEKVEQFFRMIEKRLSGIPVQYIVGHCEFMGIDLNVGPGVLIPRDDTEVLVRETVQAIKSLYDFSKRPLNIIDLCSGSGAIALSLKKILGSNVNVCALEFYDVTLKYLKDNILKNNMDIKMIQGDIFNCHKNFTANQIDCIVSNPPYIPTKHLKFLHPDVRREPVVALDGGDDGLDFYRTISQNWCKKLTHGGLIALEIGINQEKSVCELLKSNGITDICVYDDINKIPRVVMGKK